MLACVSLEEADIRHVIAHLPAGTRLTAGEIQVLAQVCGGYSAKQIARLRGTSARTVEKQKQTAMAKLGLRSVLELAAAVGRGGASPPGAAMRANDATARRLDRPHCTQEPDSTTSDPSREPRGLRDAKRINARAPS